VAKVVTCPSCQAKGSVPDDSKAAKIRCPKCGQMFDVKGASGGATSASMKKPGTSAGPRPAAKPRSAAYEDLEGAEPLPPIANSGSRRSMPAAPGRGQAQAQGSGQSPLLYVVLGVGSVAVLLLIGLLIAVLMRGNGNGGNVAAAPEGGGRPTEVVEAAPTPQPIQPVTTAPVVTPTSTPVDVSSSASYAAIDSAEVVRRLKDATVYIKNNIAGKTIASGTGFVIKVIGGNTAILATNRHVVDVDISDLPPKFAPEGSKIELEVVFRSGQGLQKEQSLPAQVIGADSSGDISNDLAFLVVKGVKQAPTPINVNAKSDTTEGMAYTGAGFPFGGILAKVNESKGNPGVTITRGGISRLVKDDHGYVDLFQVDGSLQPGNSGGPIVEEKTGKFIGVVVAKMGAVDTIGFVVPAEQLRKTLAGKIGALDLTLNAIQKDSADLEIKAEIVDPEGGGVRDVVILASTAASAAISPNSDGSWPPLPNSTPIGLLHDPKTQSASGKVKIALTGEGAAARKVRIQSAFKDRKGQLVLSKPKEYELPEKPGRIRPPGILERIVKNARRKSFEMLKTFVDPSKDCKLVKDEEGMKFKIEVPGNKVHTLATYAVTRIDKKKTLHNAPMALAEVEGDFVAMVEVTGEMSPGSTLPKDRQGNDLPFTFNGAGLVLYKDKDNFVRLERTAGISLANLQSISKVLIEIVKDGKHLDTTNIYWPVPEANVQLFMVRRKGKARFQFRPSGTNATFASPEYELDLPKKVKVGLTASNISAKPFTANFEDFAILSDTTVIDEEFGAPPEKPKEEKPKS
jgi:regulation of enolase protein 1 (concanavalin A-like superfamily)